MKRFFALLALLGLAASARPLAVATLPPYASLAAEVLGEGWTVKTLLPPGANPHLYQPRPSDLKAVAQARLVLVNGFGLDDWVVERLIAPNHLQAQVYRADAELSIFAVQLPSGEADPHVWTDPVLMALWALGLAEAAAELDPGQAAAYRRRAHNLVVRLLALDLEVRRALREAPGRGFVAFKNPFSYVVRRYDLKRLFLIGKSPEAEVSARELAEAARVLKAHGLKGFLAPLALKGEAERIARNLGVQAYYFDLLDQAHPDYFSTWAANVKSLLAALGR